MSEKTIGEKTRREKRKNVLIAAGIVCVLIIGTVAAYFTSTDEASNVFTVGNVDITLTEPNFDEDKGANGKRGAIVPNQVIRKDPTITNVSSGNDAYVFLRVTVPKKVVRTAKVDGTASEAGELQALFQINGANAPEKAWKGVNPDGRKDTFNGNWVLMKYDASNEEYNEYILSYVENPADSSGICKALAPGESTTAFDSVTFANILEGQGLEDTDLTVRVEAFAIQTDNVGGAGTAAKKSHNDVWNVLEKQIDTNGLGNGNALSEGSGEAAEEPASESGN